MLWSVKYYFSINTLMSRFSYKNIYKYLNVFKLNDMDTNVFLNTIIYLERKMSAIQPNDRLF